MSRTEIQFELFGEHKEVAVIRLNRIPKRNALSGLDSYAPVSDVLASAPVTAQFQKIINQLALSTTGSASRIARMCLLAEPPTIDRSEVTDKGSINQRAVLMQRAETVDALHADKLHSILKPITA
jgi:feruloyl-CoA synthase